MTVYALYVRKFYRYQLFVEFQNIYIYKSKSDHFQFGLVFIKKIIKLNFFLKNQNQFKLTGFGSVRFFGQKQIQTDLTRFWMSFSLVWLGFFGLTQFWLSFFRFEFGLWLIKSKSNRTGRFFKNFNLFNQFFFTVRFFQLFFFRFSRFN